ncbi:hypothetical protein CC86DRAFT_461771 [Ophiobolus disseminans]|uniref:Uncharacterized protein n=1 Tax=Ophiobolus disseminans TaxID=1469910 RepID=A0A6A7AL43_9PLEO|nr:hypothetical protein CC86DRAFT_461771 [Ophiobolus disseminans]
MPGLPFRKPAAVSLVQDQDVYLVDEDKADFPSPSSALQRKTVLSTSLIRPRSLWAGELKRSGTNKHGQHEGENREGLLVVMAHLHGLDEQKMEELGLYKISVLGAKLKDWFVKWYEASMDGIDLNIDSARGLAMPCQLLDHAHAFARVTKWLPYNRIGHVKERPPKGFMGSKDLHLPPGEFVGPVNHARGGRKTSLHKSLYKKCGHLLRYDTDKCTCWDSTVGQYFYALTKIDVFPVEDVISYSSIQQITGRLGRFEYNHMPACRRCRQMDWESVVLKAKANTEHYFNGLCLDCMDRSKP